MQLAETIVVEIQQLSGCNTNHSITVAYLAKDLAGKLLLHI